MHADIARMAWSDVRVAHCLYPPWEAREFSSTSEPGSIAVAFTGQSSVINYEGKATARARHIDANSVGLCGEAAIHWLRVTGPSEVLEITADRVSRQQIAESMGVARHAHLDDMHGWHDAVIHAGASRLRAATRGFILLSDIERDELVRRLYSYVYRLKFGGRWPPGRPSTLSTRQLNTVIDYVHNHLNAELSIGKLAELVDLSSFHFARSFKASIGLAPHRFVTSVRLQQALELLARTPTSVVAVAAAVGYSNVNHFRRMFHSQFGRLPSQSKTNST